MSQDPDLEPADGEQCIALTRDFRLLQKRRGHRYSVDDMLVAHLACTMAPAPRRVLDLGCGLGSVLLITAWRYPEAELVGLEALDEHVDYAKRNIHLNGCQERSRAEAGDLRDLDRVRSLGTFDLITASPPYFDPAAGTLCQDPARAAAHFELRGGIEGYAAAAAEALAPEGVMVGCAGALPEGRLQRALADAGLALRWLREVSPRQGKPPFLLLFVAGREASKEVERPEELVLRDGEGRRTEEHREIRRWTGLG